MTFHIDVIGSSSKGNSFLVSNKNTSILLDAGMSFQKIQKACGYNMSDIDACLITHEHKDHTRSLKKIADSAVDCYMTHGTINELKLMGHRIKSMAHGKPVEIKPGIIAESFPVTHDAADPCGFLIQDYNEDKKFKLLYATDTGLTPEVYPDLTHIIIECNYIDSMLYDSDFINAERVKSTHLGLRQLLVWLKNIVAMGAESLEEVILCHISSHHCDPLLIEAESLVILPMHTKLRIA